MKHNSHNVAKSSQEAGFLHKGKLLYHALYCALVICVLLSLLHGSSLVLLQAERQEQASCLHSTQHPPPTSPHLLQPYPRTKLSVYSPSTPPPPHLPGPPTPFLLCETLSTLVQTESILAGMPTYAAVGASGQRRARNGMKGSSQTTTPTGGVTASPTTKMPKGRPGSGSTLSKPCCKPCSIL